MRTSLASPLADHPLAPAFEACAATDFAAEPLYAMLCRLMARSPGLLALLDAAPATQQRANLILAALHHEVLRQAEDEGDLHASGPADALTTPALGDWFASTGGQRSPDDAALPAALATFSQQHAPALAQLIAQRRTQTNEVGRCAVLRPALDAIARRHGPALALFDFGCSAGLNLGLADYRIDYRSQDANHPPAWSTGAMAPEAAVLTCQV
ncbi:DUF2332 family protein, partial [Ideonella sp.]|uniref:DUF2332 family protein n=1 Tax=Ideonella sp. TaxID=1929293 RepID=UPI003BB52B7E